MPEIFLTIFFISVLLFFLGSGIWVALSMIGVSAIGMMLFTSRPVGDAMATTIWGTSSSWTLTALPLFVWMGEILFRTKLSENLFKGLSPWTQKLPGGLIHVNVVGCALFAAISGSSAATVATVGKMSIPELRKRNYPENMTIGTLAGSATLGLMIPPSLTLIVYGVTINESIVQLFMAGIFPGLVLALLFMTYVATWATINKSKMPEKDPQIPFIEKIKRFGCKSGIAIHPEIKIENIEKYLHLVDMVIVMTVIPGFGGQKFMENQLDKIYDLCKIRDKKKLSFEIEIDGGINNKTSKLCIQKGADILVAGSYIYNEKESHYKRLIDSLR